MNRVQDEIRRESNCESSSQNVPSAPAAIVTNDLFVLHIKYIIIMILPSNTRFKRFGTSRRQAYNAQDALLSITHISPGYHVSITEVSHGYHLHRAQQTPADSLWRSYVCFLSGHREQTTWMPHNLLSSGLRSWSFGRLVRKGVTHLISHAKAQFCRNVTKR
jgi:hypothetical protein